MASLTAKTEKYVPLIDDKAKQIQVGGTLPYDQYRVPPNFPQAQDHHLATRVAKPLDKANLRIDEASNLPIENRRLSICCDLYELNFLSPGYPMYFQFIKFCLVIGLATFLASGVHNIYANKHGTACMNSTAYYDDYASDNTTVYSPALPFFTYFQDGDGTTTTTSNQGQTTTTTAQSDDNTQTTTTTTTTPQDDGQATTTTTTTTTNQQPDQQPSQSNDAQVSHSNPTHSTKVKAHSYTHSNDDTSDDWAEECPQNHFNVLSLANITNDDAELEKEDIYNFFNIVVLLLIMQFIRKIQKQTAVICDEREITASDYTIRVTNLPRNFGPTADIDEEIKMFFVEKGLPGTRLNVQNVSVCYDCSEQHVVEQKLAKAIENRQKLKARKNNKNELISDDEIASLKTEIQTYKDQLLAISSKFQEGKGVGKQFEGEAYVTFETQQEMKAVVKHWNLTWFRRFRHSFRRNSPFSFNGKILRVIEAPEPSDIAWENAGTGPAAKFFIRTMTTLIILGLLFAGFVIIFLIQKYKTTILQNLKTSKSQADTKRQGLVASFQIKVITIGASCVIVLINMILRIVIQNLTQRGKFSTYTEYLSVYARRLALTQFINTCIVSFVVSVIFKNIRGEGGLIYTATFIILTDISVQVGLSLFNIAYFTHAMKKNSISKQKEPIITQKQLNDIYKLPPFDFATKYASYAKMMLSASFFAPLIPVVSVFAIVGIFILYWLDKYNLLRRSSRGRAAGTELPFEFVEYLEYCLVLYSLGNFLVNVFVIDFDPTGETLTILGAVIGLLNALLPMDEINEYLFPGKDEALTDDKYSVKKYSFVEDYDRMNPATADVANKTFNEHRRTVGSHAP